MKIYVVCDLEGVAGVIDRRQQCQWDVAMGWYAPYLAQARRLATLELNALVEGALQGGATEVVAWDGHGNNGRIHRRLVAAARVGAATLPP